MPIKDNLAYTVISSGITWDENGIAQAVLIASMGKSGAVAKALSIKAHPDYPYMLRTGGTVTAKECDLAEINLQFVGIDPDVDGQVTSSFRAATSTEPIDTHPTFGSGNAFPVDGWAVNFGAQFNPDGSFKKFPPKIEQVDANLNIFEIDNPKAGVESYLEPSVTFEQSKIFAKASKNELNKHCKNIGKIDSDFFKGTGIPKPPTPMGDNGKPRNWLLISAVYEDIGKGGKVTKVWQMSGRRGWDETVYS